MSDTTLDCKFRKAGVPAHIGTGGAGRGYQTLINEALRASLTENERPLTAKVMRKIVREELAHAR